MNLTPYRSVLLLLLSVLLLPACSASTPTPAAPLPTRPAAPFNDVLEMQFNQPAEPLPDGPISGLVGFYNGQQITFCQLERSTLRCNRYPVTLDGVAPGLARVDGRLSGGALNVSRAEPLNWDSAAQQAAAQAKLEEIAEELARYDWSQIALERYAESSGWFRPDAERLKTIPLELYAYDAANNLVIWRGQGWEMPQQTRIVHRFPALYFVTDPAGVLPTRAIITIEGYVEE